MPQLLIELYSEEMPAGLQEVGAQTLKNSFINGFEEEGLAYGKSQIFWSPMRLSLIIENVAICTDDLVIEKKQEIEDFVINQDWDDIAIELWKKKDEWINLDFFEQTKWRTDYFGLSPEKFKNVIWVS